MVRDFHRVISHRSARADPRSRRAACRTPIVACVGGGSNAIGAFYEFLPDANVQLIGVEAGGRGTALGEHAARFQKVGGGLPGVLQGTYCYVLQNDAGQVATHALGLRGPRLRQRRPGARHAARLRPRRVRLLLGRGSAEGHRGALAHRGHRPRARKRARRRRSDPLAPKMGKDQIIMVNLSGRGDKDMGILARELDLKGAGPAMPKGSL